MKRQNTKRPRNTLPSNSIMRSSFASAPQPTFAADAPFDLCFTPAAMEDLLASVGTRVPETGAKGFGPTDRFGFDVVEFDIRGSDQAGGAVYSPDVPWGEQRCQHWLNQPGNDMRLWSGDVHSHPGKMGHPSGKSGTGLGDLGYVEEVFAQNEAMQFFAIPIVTLAPPGCPTLIWPWIVSRDNPHRPLWANLRVCPASEFPERQFNPIWENGLNTVDSDQTSETYTAPETYAAPDSSPKAPGLLMQDASVQHNALMLGVAGVYMISLAFIRFFAQPERPKPSLLLSGIVSQNNSHAIPEAALKFSKLSSPIATIRRGVTTGRTATSSEETIMNAYDIIARLNPNALSGEENGRDVFIEDFAVDNRWYRIEYRCLPSGANTSAWLLANPWGSNTFSYEQSHLRRDGLICIGPHYDPDDSPFDLEYAIRRARFWAVGYAFLMEYGYAATCAAITDW